SQPNNPKQAAAQRALAFALLAMGDVNFRLQAPSTATASFEECLEVLHALSQKYPKAAVLKQDLGRASAYAGDFYLRSGDLTRARQLYDKGLALAEEIVKLDGRQVDYQWDLAHAHYRLGLLGQRSKDAGEAARHFGSCLATREKLASQDKKN